MSEKQLIIKGSKFEAARAAADRNIPLAFLRESDGLTTGKTNASIDTLNAWLCEDTEPPFPVGSLLFWSLA